MRTTIDTRQFIKILQKNDYVMDRYSGSHKVFTDGVNTISVPKNINKMIALRLIKQYALNV